MAERLREVAELLARRGVDLLREQAQVVGVPCEPIEELLRPRVLARLGQARDEPEGADHERPLLPLEPVGIQPDLVAVTQYEAALRELPRNRLDRRAHPLVRRREEADDRHHERRRVELLRLERLGVRPARLAPAALEDRLAHPVALRRPLVLLRELAERGGELHRPSSATQQSTVEER